MSEELSDYEELMLGNYTQTSNYFINSFGILGLNENEFLFLSYLQQWKGLPNMRIHDYQIARDLFWSHGMIFNTRKALVEKHLIAAEYDTIHTPEVGCKSTGYRYSLNGLYEKIIKYSKMDADEYNLMKSKAFLMVADKRKKDKRHYNFKKDKSTDCPVSKPELSSSKLDTAQSQGRSSNNITTTLIQDYINILSAKADNFSGSVGTTELQETEGEHQTYDTDIKGNIDLHDEKVPPDSAVDDNCETDSYTPTPEEIAEEERLEAEYEEKRKPKRPADISQYQLPSDVSLEVIKAKIWDFFKKGSVNALKHRAKLMSMTKELEDNKEKLLEAVSYLHDYWDETWWYKDGSLIMFLMNFDSFASNITAYRWQKLEEYCKYYSDELVEKAIVKNNLFNIMKRKKLTAQIKSLIEEGRLKTITDVQLLWLTADPDKLLYNAADCICLEGSLWGDMIRPSEFKEITTNAIIAMMDDNEFELKQKETVTTT